MRLLDPVVRFVEDTKKAPWAIQLLIGLALFSYLSEGLFASFFSSGSGFKPVHEAASQILSGQGSFIYDNVLAFLNPANAYVCPPVVAMFYLPFGLLSFPVAFTIFQVVSHLALWVSFGLWIRWNEGMEPFDARWKSFVLLFLFFPLHYSFQLGRNESLVLLILAVSFILHRRRWSMTAAFLMAAAIYLKAFVAFLLLYYLVKGRYRHLARCLFWIATFSALSLILVPWSVQARYYMDLIGSLKVESVELQVTRVLQVLFFVGVSGAYVWVVRRSHEEKPAVLALSLTFVSMLLLSPRLATYHYTFLLVPFLLLRGFYSVKPMLGVFYGFFAVFHPLIASRVMEPGAIFGGTSRFSDFVLAVPFFMLIVFWFWLFRALLSPPVLNRDNVESATGGPS